MPESTEDRPWSVYICTIVYEQSDHHFVPTGTSGMERENAIDDYRHVGTAEMKRAE
jgi:hypothetical protein